MAQSVRFACTSLDGVNRAGIIKVDENGYYPMVVGALNMFNSAGEFYEAEEAKSLFTDQSGPFMRRVKRGACRGEYGHPKPLPGQSERSFASRCLSILEDRVCAHHAEITLDFDNVKDRDGKSVIAIISKVRPSGPFGPTLKDSLNNPKENVCFSIRAFTDDKVRGGVTYRTLKQIVTFDYVNEPGMSVAEKFFSPALESRYDRIMTRTLLENGLAEEHRNGIATEAVLLTANELFSAMRWNVDPGLKPAWVNW
jgi:hypothetical protein